MHLCIYTCVYICIYTYTRPRTAIIIVISTRSTRSWANPNGSCTNTIRIFIIVLIALLCLIVVILLVISNSSSSSSSNNDKIMTFNCEDYSELGNSQWVLHVVERSGRSTSFQFEKKEILKTNTYMML